jgi:hypothetical protein
MPATAPTTSGSSQPCGSSAGPSASGCRWRTSPSSSRSSTAGAAGPSKDQLRSFVLDKVAETQRRTADLIGFLGQLQTVAARLGQHTPDGMCDDLCGCTTDGPDATDTGGWVGATLVPSAGTADRGGEAVPIACTLAPDRMNERIAAWQTLTATALDREALDNGARIHLPRTTDLVALAQLVADEQTCCAFFTFAITINHDTVRLDVTAPPDGLSLAQALVGAPTGALA